MHLAEKHSGSQEDGRIFLADSELGSPVLSRSRNHQPGTCAYEPLAPGLASSSKSRPTDRRGGNRAPPCAADGPRDQGPILYKFYQREIAVDASGASKRDAASLGRCSFVVSRTRSLLQPSGTFGGLAGAGAP